MWIFILLLVAVLCLLSEIFLPGGMLGALGVLLALIAIGVAVHEHGWGYAAILFVVCFVLGIAILTTGFRLLPRSKMAQGLILSSSTAKNEGYSSQNQSLEALVGKEGTARSDLRPTGVALIEGKRVDIVSEGGYIEKGTMIRVVAVKGNRVVVRKV